MKIFVTLTLMITLPLLFIASLIWSELNFELTLMKKLLFISIYEPFLIALILFLSLKLTGLMD